MAARAAASGDGGVGSLAAGGSAIAVLAVRLACAAAAVVVHIVTRPSPAPKTVTKSANAIQKRPSKESFSVECPAAALTSGCWAHSGELSFLSRADHVGGRRRAKRRSASSRSLLRA